MRHANNLHATAGRPPVVACAAGVAVLIAAAAASAAVGISGPGPQSITHNTSNAPQAFPETTWALTSTLELLGATVTLTSGPFAHTGNANLKADCKLDLRVLSSSGLAGWSTTIPSDQTNFAGGKNSALVRARSTGTGGGSVGLTVTFQQSNFSILGAGNYTTTVTGTIVSNL